MTAEIIAILIAVQEIKRTGLQGSVILTDSLSSCKVLENSLNSVYRSEIVDNILDLCENLNIAIQWTPSHIGLSGNDEADELAKQGAETPDIQQISNMMLLKDSYLHFQRLKQQKSNEWYSSYAENLSKGNKFYHIQDHFSDKPWYHKAELSNTETRTLNRLMAGHDYTKYWLYKMKLVDDPNCEICDQPETAEHIILHCSRFNNLRSKYNFDCRFQNLSDLLKLKDIALLKEVVDFLKYTQTEI